jgi:D-alanine-D-alanine ligase
MLDYAGIPLPKGVEMRPGDDIPAAVARIADELGFPVVVKPNRQGSTIGLTIARTLDDLPTSIELAFQYDQDVLIEEFVEGTEITVPVLGNQDLQALPIVEIVPEGGFYDYHAKYTQGATDEIVPARLPEDIYRRAQDLAVECHKVLGCRGMSRTDMMIRGDDMYVLEVNTIPGMTPTSLLPRSAQAAGIEFPELLDRLIGLALE